MIVDDIDVVSIDTVPFKTDPPLIVYPDAVLTASVPFQGLKMIRWRNFEVVYGNGAVDHPQFTTDNIL